MPFFPTKHTLETVFSASSPISPSLMPKEFPSSSISSDISIASNAVASLAAQVDFAPSHIKPPTLTNVDSITLDILPSGHFFRYAMPAPAAAAAEAAPQKADKLPIFFFAYIDTRLLTSNPLKSSSSVKFFSLANSITGRETASH